MWHILQEILNAAIIYEFRRLWENTGKFEHMAWDVMEKNFYIDTFYRLSLPLSLQFLLHCPLCSVFHILFLEAATENYLLKYVFPENKQNRLKVAGNKPFPK